MSSPDYVIAGAGIIGLSLALELHGRGAYVTVLEAGQALAQTSFAAAGMLAPDDPANPPALHALSTLSAALYPAFLANIQSLSGIPVPFQTFSTLDSHPGPDALEDPHSVIPQLAPKIPALRLLQERSVDPRQLATALLGAVRATSIQLHERTPLTRLAVRPGSVHIEASGRTLDAAVLVDAMGAWSPAGIAPRKGQMLSVRLPPSLPLEIVVRTPNVYIVPRTAGPNTGIAIIGATLEDAGFNLDVHPRDIIALNARAVELLPGLAQAEFVESWAGLRPATRDGLPILGSAPQQPRYLLATGHFRNGILLAPATARVLADLLAGLALDVDLTPFAADRFERERSPL